MQPRYVTLSSSGVSPWQLTNWHGFAPMQLGFGIRVASLSSQYAIDVTLDDPGTTFASSAGPTTFSASAIGGPATSSQNQIASISTAPIAAWRLTNNSTGGSVTVTFMQVGIG